MEAVVVDSYPSVAELVEADWQMIVAKSDSLGDSPNYYAVDSDRRWTQCGSRSTPTAEWPGSGSTARPSLTHAS